MLIFKIECLICGNSDYYSIQYACILHKIPLLCISNSIFRRVSVFFIIQFKILNLFYKHITILVSNAFLFALFTDDS